jgi:hypothetical protein
MAGFDARIYQVKATLSPAAGNTITAAQQTFNVPGVEPEDILLAVNKPTDQAGLAIAMGRVTARDTVGIKFVNPTAGNITPTAAEVYTFTLMKPGGLL